MQEAIQVLVVEDEILIRMDIVDYLAGAGFIVHQAANARQAIDILTGNEQIRAMFTDIDMPGDMNGQALAALASDRWPPLKIILTSGYKLPVTSRHATRFRFIDKPYDPEKVVAVLREATS